MQYIDFHCDTLKFFGGLFPLPEGDKDSDDLLYENHGMVDLKRLREGGCTAQFFATFLPPVPAMKGISDETYRQELYAGLMGSISRHSDLIALAKNFEEYETNRQKGLISAFLTFEDGRMIDGSIENLQKYYSLGYRLITLTWNQPNCFGYPNSSDPELMKKGLTSFGKEAVQQMNQLGMIIDVSHLSDGGFYDVAQISKKPFIASHSCARALTPHARNLTDDMIRKIAQSGGLVGVNFAPKFTGKSVLDSVSTIDNICAHVQHIADVGGMDAIAIGSDFDGISGTLQVSSPLDMHLLFDRLSHRGFTATDIEKFARLNAERILKDVLS